MFFNNEDKSIRNQLITMQVAIAILAILLVSGISIFNSVYHFKEIQKENLIWLSDFLAHNNYTYFEEVVIFENQGLAEDLDIKLAKQEQIENVSFFTTKGINFYSFNNNNDFNFTLPLEDLQNENKIGITQDAWGFSSYFRKVFDSSDNGGGLVGYICIKENKSKLYTILTRYFALTILSLVLVGLLAYYLARQLQSSISSPILKLNEAVSKFGKSSQHELAPIGGSTELAELGTSFNEMVAQIKDRDKKLKSANENLESEVEERTTELRKTVESLAQRTKELKITNKELEQFAYIASHDLQEPLRSISSFTQLLERKLKKSNIYDEKAQEYFNFIVGGTRRMQSVIKDVLLFSGINEKPDFVKTDLNLILNETLNSLQAKIWESGAVINVPFPLPTIEVDPKQIPHLFQNLISNAIKFNTNENPEVIISFKEKGLFWEFFVRDNGIGIDDEYKDKIFRMFKRLHSKEEYPGTGIGLAVCKKIIDSHEGNLWVESEIGKGATFHFTIMKNLKYHSMISNERKKEIIDKENV